MESPEICLSKQVGFGTTAEHFFLAIDAGGPEPLVTVKCDGTITYGKDYEPDKAARIFWEAMARNAPKFEASGNVGIKG